MMKNRILAAAGAAALSACSSVGGQLADVVFVPNGRSAKVDAERVEVNLAFSPVSTNLVKVVEDKKNELTFEFLSGGLSGALASAVVDEVSETLAAEAERYQATYSAEAGGEHFFIAPYVAKIDRSAKADGLPRTNVRFAGFKLTRTAEARGDKKKAAMTACFIALPGSTDAFFHLIPVSYELNYSKAKLIAFDLTSPFGVDILNPWEIVTDPLFGDGYELPPTDRDLDLRISVTLDNLSYDKDGKLAATSRAAEPIDLKGVQVSPPTDGKGRYFPAYEKFLAAVEGPDSKAFEFSCNAEASPEKIAALRDKILDFGADDFRVMTLMAGGRAFPSPKRALPKGESNANFLVKALVEETDNYGARVKELNAKFDKQKGGVQKSISDLIDGAK